MELLIAGVVAILTALNTQALAVNKTSAPVELLDIYSLHIRSDIAYRFANTHVISKLANRHPMAKEVAFHITLPKAAFISEFAMEIDGKIYRGDVKEKEAAKKTYQKAKSKGQSAGHVAAKPRDTNSFKVAVNVAAHSKVSFNLTYQELLKRRLGIYEHVIHVDPGQLVRHLQIDVHIHESRKITYLQVPPLRTDLQNAVSLKTNPYATIQRKNSNSVHIRYHPDEMKQKEVSTKGLSGQFVVQYDVERTLDAGDIQVVDGYFVHYLSPALPQQINKNIVFVLDTSTSMTGTKLHQMKTAMKEILTQLKFGDYFNLLEFNSGITRWKTSMMPYNSGNLANARQWTSSLRARGYSDIVLFVLDAKEALMKSRSFSEHCLQLGSVADVRICLAVGTNINDALLQAVKVLNNLVATQLLHGRRTSLIVFLTDGQPSTGITSISRIMQNVKQENRNRFGLFSLGFGNNVDFTFLKQLSLQNDAVARKIYADSDAALQLKGFYEEVASPLLSEVKVEYVGDVVKKDSLTKTTYHTYFNGSEIIVAGILKDNSIRKFSSKISANSLKGPLVLNKDVNVHQARPMVPRSAQGLRNFTQRLWAYLTIKELLNKMVEATTPATKTEYKNKSLELSLKYHFVTPLTSMVVVKPEAPSKDVSELDESEEYANARGVSGNPSPSSSGGHGGGGGGGGGFADNDPHFIVKIHGSSTPICFDVMGKEGEVYQLIQDGVKGITVNGQIIGEKSNKPGRHKTYFGQVAVVHGKSKVIVTPKTIKFNAKRLQWRKSQKYKVGDIVVEVRRKRHITVSFGHGLQFSIMRHLAKAGRPTKVSYLGLYMVRSDGLSKVAHGLLGQFQHRKIHIPRNIDELTPLDTSKLHFLHEKMSQKVEVHPSQRYNMARKIHVPCWFVRDNGRGLLIGHYRDYIVPNLTFAKLPKRLRKK